MKLDRNVNPDGSGKYALIKLRCSTVKRGPEPGMVMVDESAVDFGDTPDTDFFVIRLKDKYASPALAAYAMAAMEDDPEYGHEVLSLAMRAAIHPNKRKPD